MVPLRAHKRACRQSLAREGHMSTVNRKEFRKRLLEAISRKTGKPEGKGWTVFARECGITVSVFQSYMDPDTPSEPRGDNLLRIARAAGVTPEWLLYGPASERGAGSMPVARNVSTRKLGTRSADSHLGYQIPIYPFDGKALAYGKDDRPAGNPAEYLVRTFDNFDPKAYALRVEAHALVPRFWPGDVLEVRTDRPIRSGQIAVVQAVDGRTWVRIVDLRARAGRLVLTPWTPTDETVDLSEVDVRFLHRVVGVRCRGMY
jgi:phage repressor protein C with HTH and peptisase S24 domain